MDGGSAITTASRLSTKNHASGQRPGGGPLDGGGMITCILRAGTRLLHWGFLCCRRAYQYSLFGTMSQAGAQGHCESCLACHLRRLVELHHAPESKREGSGLESRGDGQRAGEEQEGTSCGHRTHHLLLVLKNPTALRPRLN